MTAEKDIAVTGAKYLADLVGEDGRFKYRFNPETNTIFKGYNVLRHAGTIWSMLDVFTSSQDEYVLEKSKSAATYLLNNYLSFFRSYNNACICEDNKIKLGGNALAIMAFTSLYNVTSDDFLINISERLAHFMIKMRQPDGDLIHKRFFRSGKISSFKSMYYTGEALLAFLTLYKVTQNSIWLNVVKDIEGLLAPKSYGVTEQSHWMLYALESLSKFDSSEIYYKHAVEIVEHILTNPLYLTWDRSTPIACRSEGLIAFLNMKHPSNLEDQNLKNRCIEQVKHNLECQKFFIVQDGAFMRGGDDARRFEIRIDYTQHNISSFLHFSHLQS